MRILLLGGTIFLGRAVTDAALAAGHSVTHLHRGRSGVDARVDTRRADRTDAVALTEALQGGAWDAVIDNSGYLPQVVAISTDLLRGRCARYLFVSSISVYTGPAYDEDAAVAPPTDPLPDAWTPETYGSLKAMCENVVRDRFGPGALVVRPGLIVGPHDPTDRFTYWPVRASRGGEMLAPDDPGRRVQFINVRDLATWMVRLLEDDASGTFNATGPAEPLTMGEFIAACIEVGAAGTKATWASEEFLLAQGVQPWREMPLWVAAMDAKLLGTPIDRAIAAGLTFRPLRETIYDTLAWARTRPADHPWRAGISAERERELLAAL